jgi:hypothetical protein
MPEQQFSEEKIKMLVKFVDDNFKKRRSRDIFRLFLPALLVLVMLLFIVFLMIYQWTNVSILNWTPGLVSIVALILAFNSYAQSAVQSVNKQLAYGLAVRLRRLLSDKSEEAFHLLVPLVALKQDNYPAKLSVLYDIDKSIFKPDKLAEYFYFKK